MSNLTQFLGGNGPVASIQNGGASSVGALNTAVAIGNLYTALSGDLGSAGTLATALEATGRGRLLLAGLYTMDATSRTLRMKITVDGVAIIDVTSAAIANSGSGIVPLGSISASLGICYHPIDYTASLKIEFASSIDETDKQTVFWLHEVWA